MAATKRSTDYLINESTGSFKDANNITAGQARDMIFSAYQPQAICNGRLTLESGVPISTTDQTAKTNVYFTPFQGNCIGIYDGTSWTLRTFSELTLALGTTTSVRPHDVFIYDNAGTLTLEHLVWTSDTARATALTLQDGVLSKTGALTRRYLGTFRTTSTTTTEDSGAPADGTTPKRFLWNQYNRVQRGMTYASGNVSHSVSSGTTTNWNSSSTNSMQFVIGQAQTATASASCQMTPSSSTAWGLMSLSRDGTNVGVETGMVGTTASNSVVTAWAAQFPVGFGAFYATERAFTAAVTMNYLLMGCQIEN